MTKSIQSSFERLNQSSVSTTASDFQSQEDRKLLRLESSRFFCVSQDLSKKKKTELCKNWELHGNCPFNEKVIMINKCTFAHGYGDIKSKSNSNLKFKTSPCKSYFMRGVCQYGHRCQYIHCEIVHMGQFKDFLLGVYKNKDLPFLALARKKNQVYTSRLSLLQKVFLIRIDRDTFIEQKECKRLPLFKTLTSQDDRY